MHTVHQLARGTRRLFMRLYELGIFALLLGTAWAAGLSVAPLADEDEGLMPPPAYCGNSQSSTVVMHR